MKHKERILLKKVENGEDLLDALDEKLIETPSKVKNMRNFDSRVRDYQKSIKKGEKDGQKG